MFKSNLDKNIITAYTSTIGKEMQLSVQAFDLYYRFRTLALLRFIDNNDSLEIITDVDTKMEFAWDDRFQKVLAEYVAIKKEIASHHKYSNYDGLFQTQIIPLEGLIPPQKKWKRKIIDYIYYHENRIDDISHILAANKIKFYEGKNILQYVFALKNGFANARKIYKALSSDTFGFLYLSQKVQNPNSFDSTHSGERYHLNEILEMENNTLNPPIYFCGGLNSIGSWDPYPTYKRH
ncbi:MAG: hypothetical protein RLN90_09725 [Balneolaceae bacterium]